MEIRNDSFVDPSFVALLRKHCVALVIAGTPGKWPQYEDVTADFVYIRLHGDEDLYKSAYMEGALTRWAGRIRQWSQGGEPSDARRIVDKAAAARRSGDVFCYFDNTEKMEAPDNARRLMKKLNIAWPIEPQSKHRDSQHSMRRSLHHQGWSASRTHELQMPPFVGPSDAAPRTLDQTNALNPFPAS
jgi:uncharacterized protein YecE (DUF72 family)